MKPATETTDLEPVVISWLRLLWVLLTIDLLFVLASLGQSRIPWFGWKFDLAGEGNFPAWWSGIQLLLISPPAFARGLQLWRSDRRSHWRAYFLIAAGFVFLSADEIVQIHETINHVAYQKMRLQGHDLGSHDNRGWIGVVLYGVVGVVLLSLLWRDFLAVLRERAGRRSLIVAVFVYLMGAVIVDNLMTDFEKHYPKWQSALEEGLEMAGVSILLVAFVIKLGAFSLVVTAPDGRGSRSSSTD